ncbi:MAG: CxxxxCH/CxxCH domain-containing protein [Chloroflexi bacterium]|nr:MAG: CxxxxCH/CxxCH domain-containing protein [Chloroflexota bacterium]
MPRTTRRSNASSARSAASASALPTSGTRCGRPRNATGTCRAISCPRRGPRGASMRCSPRWRSGRARTGRTPSRRGAGRTTGFG